MDPFLTKTISLIILFCQTSFVVVVTAFFNNEIIPTKKCCYSTKYPGRRQRSIMTSFPSVKVPWYSDPKIERDRSHIIKDENSMLTNLLNDTSRFVLFVGNSCLHKNLPSSNIAQPIYLSASEMNNILEKSSQPTLQELVPTTGGEPYVGGGGLVVWLGKLDQNDYWAVHIQQSSIDAEDIVGGGGVLKPLREFGDRLESETDAAILATGNGMVQFHNSHKFCSNCGSRTIPAKAGSCRRCAGGESSCKRSVYPRLDVATIMLITSYCGNFALLGRKANWPKGRYSTLAGFAEVGETLEKCCIRETFEESGVKVDRDTVNFVASQPWPFPRSLMVGFQARARAQPNSKNTNNDKLPQIVIDRDEMEDIQWFSKEYVGERLEGGSTARDYIPTEREAEFHIPGKSSLARLLITRWVEESD